MEYYILSFLDLMSIPEPRGDRKRYALLFPVYKHVRPHLSGLAVGWRHWFHSCPSESLPEGVVILVRY